MTLCALDRGEMFVVTRNGVPVGELTPLRRRRFEIQSRRAHDATFVPHMWYKRGMARVRISTTVDEQLLATARRTRSELADAALIDEALGALLARHRGGEIDAAYAAYERVPLNVDDEWGNLASFRTAAGAS
ncbi:MAG TPA: hypothetical protein VMU73_11175 [Gaiellaceae bacterium]|nr:hypothetical protein [Gaiellaceae bacterium]